MKAHQVPIHKRLGDIAVSRGLISPEQLNDLLRTQKKDSQPLGRLLIKTGALDEEQLSQILGEQLGIPHVWLRRGLVDPDIVQVVPKDKALHYQIIPMFRVNNMLTLAVSDPSDIYVFDEIAKLTGLEVQPVLCRADDILTAINNYYDQKIQFDEILTDLNGDDIEIVGAASEKSVSEIAEMAEGSPVVNLTNMILLKSIRDGASDIHLEPQPDKFRIRIRIDGVLYELMSPKREMQAAVVSRLKVMANLDIAERRIPQDGRFQVNVDGRVIDLRFSSMPGIFGEKVVLRILDKSKSILNVNKLGFGPDMLERFKDLLRRPHGLILVSGPTGSGKTTTLYSAITMLNSVEKNIITIEDPVEYQLKGINQNQVKEAIGLDFAKFLKHALRQDPDIILVGEIRDRETVATAVQASLTGHLVLSTLHTNDTATAITRLLEMSVEPYLISSSLLAVMSQRLVRKICPECRTGFYPSKEVIAELGMDPAQSIRFHRGKGCQACYDSGYKGRTAIHELLEVDAGLHHIIMNRPTIEAVRKHLSAKGNRSLRASGYQKVIEGLTTIEEVQRVTAMDSV